MKSYDIKLIALDLDGTALNSEKVLTERTRKVLGEAIRQGILAVFATGRAYTALPDGLFVVPDLRYVVTSNGARVTDITTGEPVYSNCIDASALESAVSVLRQYPFMLEMFIEGRAYVEKSVYDGILSTTFKETHKQYILETRTPVEGLLDFALSHKTQVENINVNFEDQTDRRNMREVLGALKGVTLTTSFDHNLELGGATTSKADAIRVLCEKYGFTKDQVMACGDSPNDAAMLKAAGLAVAMGNAKAELKDLADYVTGTNDEDGVATAIERFALNRNEKSADASGAAAHFEAPL